MKEFWRKIYSIGIDDSLSLTKLRQVKLTNQFAIVSAVAFFFGGLVDVLFGEFMLGLAVLACAPFQLIALLLNKFKQYNFASFILTFLINLALFYFTSYCSYNSGVYLYYFPFVIGIAFLFELNDNRIQFLIHFFLTIFFIFILLATKFNLFLNESLKEEAIFQMLVINSVSSVVLIAYFVVIINKSNLQLQNQLVQIIDEKNNTQNGLKNSLSEKNTLLAEVHHRVKNNLAVVSSLLNLKMDSVSNPYTKEVLLECRNRVMSMSLIHEKLYKSKSFSDVNFKLYLNELVEEIKRSYPSPDKNITIEINAEEIHLDLTSAIPCGLLVNELISNSYKHAFKNIKDGIINVSIKKNENEIQLIVSDNGVGFNLETQEHTSLGLILIDSLTEQLEAKGAYIFNGGTSFILSFVTNTTTKL